MELGLLSHRCFYAPSEQDRKLCLDRLWVQSRDCVKACSDQWFPEVGRPHRRGRARARTSPHDEAELLLEGAIPFSTRTSPHDEAELLLERSNPLWALRGSDECAPGATRAVQVLSEEAEWLLECIWAASLLQTAYQHADTTHTLNGGSQVACLVEIF